MTLKNMLQEKKTIGCFWLSLGSVPLVEFALEAKVEAVVFDLQHGLWDRAGLEQAVGIAGRKTIPLARVANCSRHDISSALDAGAQGVIVPMIETAQDAARAVNWSTYPPQGSRSGGGIRPLKDFGAYKKDCDATMVVAVMVETSKGLENIDKIAAVPGLDMIFIGTGDLSLSLGAAGTDPVMEDAVMRIRAGCDKAGLPCGIFTPDTATAVERRKQGFALVVVGDDISLSRRMIRKCQSDYTG